MGTSGSAPDSARKDIRSLFSQSIEPCTPLSAGEVAATVDCSEQIAQKQLDALAERSKLRSRDVDDQRKVWWIVSETGSHPQGSQLQEFGAFVRAVEDYAIFMLDPDGTVASWNKGAQRIKGYEKDHIAGNVPTTQCQYIPAASRDMVSISCGW